MQDLETPSLAQNHTLRHGPAMPRAQKKMISRNFWFVDPNSQAKN